MILCTIAAFLLIRSYGETLVAPPLAQARAITSTAAGADVFLRVLIALAAIIVTGRVLAKLFARINQPPVIGEVLAGILLGPSLLGPRLSALVLPPSVAPSLGVIAQLGVVLYMFIVGLELNPALLKQRAQATMITSHASILVPFLLGAVLALPLYPRLAGSNVSFTSFALFMGVAMSITAFPVLARILADYHMTRTRLGVMALGCAAVDDVTAWCLLAVSVGVAKAQISQALFVVFGALVFIAFMLLLGRPILEWLIRRWKGDPQPQTFLALIFVALLISAISAEAIGIHAIFGAFLLGAIIPHESDAARIIKPRLESVVTILLLPAFFALTGMRTRIDLLSGPVNWLICGLIVLLATLGKFGGTFIAARLTGSSSHDSAVLGTLMNTRGLMELIVLNVGLDLRIMSPTLFAMMVLMALATTILTSPVLRLLKARKTFREEESMLAESLSASNSGNHSEV
jgi:Kef-type K+ transport system membrane component KefB